MPKPPHANVFGTLEKALSVGPTGSGLLVPLEPACCRTLINMLDKTPATELHGHVYLRLESITGDFPTVLNVYLGLPEGASPAEHPEHLAGSIGLYGLLQASQKRENGEGGQGMGFSLDVTRVFKGLRLAESAATAIRVNVVPYRPMPEQARITIGKMSFFHS